LHGGRGFDDRPDVAGAGAIADASGAASQWIAAFGALLVIGSCLMWFGKPATPAWFSTAAARLSIATVGVDSRRLHNAMMPSLVAADKIAAIVRHRVGPPVMSAASSVSFWCLVFSPPIPETWPARCLDSCRYSVLIPLRIRVTAVTGPLTESGSIIFVLPMFPADARYPAQTSGARKRWRGIDRPEADAR